MGAQSPLTSSLLTPMLALIVWSLAMLAWTAVRRPAQARDEAPLTSQSTLFYALIAYSYLAGQQNGPNLILAWAYVALRLVHSLVQAMVNVAPVRLGLFMAGALALAALAGRDVWALF
jgi:hypothetical protein